MIRKIILLITLILLTTPLRAQEKVKENPPDKALPPKVLEDNSVKKEVPSPTEYLKLESKKEIKIGLQLYAEGDDYRAISALTRFRILDGSPHAVFLSNLLIGQIYHRNKQSELSVFAFEHASQSAPDAYSKTFSYLLANQESCVALSFYFDCQQRLEALQKSALDDPTRDLIDYQMLYVDLVLRRPITEKRALAIKNPILRKKAKSLLLEDHEFENLDLKMPFLSGALSTLLPGAGQLYNGRYWDALLAISFNALFAGATYYSYVELDSLPLSIMSGVLFLGFYIGNITNAVTDAQRINANRYLEFFESLKKSHWARVRFEVNDQKVTFGYVFDWK